MYKYSCGNLKRLWYSRITGYPSKEKNMQIDVAGVIDNADKYQTVRMKRAGWKDHVKALAESMKDPKVGQLVPIIVRPGPTANTHELVAGFARLEAMKLIGRTTIAATMLNPTVDTARARFTENDRRFASSIVENAAMAASYPSAEAAADYMKVSKSTAEQLRRMAKLFVDKPDYEIAVEAGRIYPSVLQLVPMKKLPDPDKLADMCEVLSARGVIEKLTGRNAATQDAADESEESAAAAGSTTAAKADTWKTLLTAVWDHVDVRKFIEDKEPELHKRLQSKLT